MSTEPGGRPVGTSRPKPRDQAELRADVALARAQLASTLGAIEYKLNLPKQVRISGRRVRIGLRHLGRKNPVALVGIAVAAAAVAVGAVWLGVKAVLNR